MITASAVIDVYDLDHGVAVGDRGIPLWLPQDSVIADRHAEPSHLSPSCFQQPRPYQHFVEYDIEHAREMTGIISRVIED